MALVSSVGRKTAAAMTDGQTDMSESSGNATWTGQDDAMLIDFVRTNEPLYNIKDKDYRKGQLKQKLWKSIGTTLDKSGSDCLKRWAYVRDYYIRRRGKPGSGGGEAAKKRAERLAFLDTVPSAQRNTITYVGDESVLSAAAAAQRITYVGDELQESESAENTQTDAEENGPSISKTETLTRLNRVEHNNRDDYNNRREEVTRERRKRKSPRCEERPQTRRETTQEKENELDETDLFFNAMTKIVKKLPRYEQIHLRMEIATLVGNAELRSISNESTPSSTNFPAERIASVKAEPSNGERQFGYVSDASLSLSNESS